MSIRRGRLRSTIKWGGAVVTLLLLIVWVGSGWYGVKGSLGQITAYIYNGLFSLRLDHPQWAKPSRLQAILPSREFPFEWWFYFEGGLGQTFVSVPIWFIALLTATPAFVIWRRDRKPLPNTCPKCGYSRTGLPVDRACPECGTAAA